MLKRERYKLSKNLTALKLRKNGFKNGTYRCNVYKDMFYFLMVIDEDNNDWSYQVVDKDNNIYAQYYDREYGINEVVEKIDKVINEVINEMVKEEILEVKKYGKYKNNRKSKHDKHSKKSGKISQSK